MKLIYSVLLVSGFFCSCDSKTRTHCFPGTPVSKIEILVADTGIMGEEVLEQRGDDRIINISDGIGFVDSSGKPSHQPLQRIELSESQKDQFLKILRPIRYKEKEIFSVSGCTPIYRHTVLFYNEENKLKGQMNICLQCQQVDFLPAANCLEWFTEKRWNELLSFFDRNNVYRDGR